MADAAAGTLKQAKALLDSEDLEKAKEAATDAKTKYEALKNLQGVADCLVVLAEVTISQVDYMRYENAFGAQDDIKDVLKDADKLIETELEKFKEAKNEYAQAQMLFAIGRLNVEKRGAKKKQKAMEAASEAETLFKKVGDQGKAAEALLVQSLCHFRGCRTDEAMDAAEEASTLAEKAGAKETEAKAKSSIAVCLGAMSDIKGAIEALNESVKLYQELGSRKQEAIQLHTLATWLNIRERPREALSNAKEALSIFEEINYGKGWIGGAMKTLALTYVELGDLTKAKELANLYLEKFVQAKDARMRALCNELLSSIHRAAGELYDSIDCAEEAVKISKNLGDDVYEAVCRQELARAQHATVRSEDFKEMVPVLDNMQTSAKLWNKTGNAKREAETWNILGELYRTTTHTIGAMETAEKAMVIYKDKADLYGQGNVLLLQAQAYLDAKMYKECMPKAKEAAALFKDVKDVTMEGECYQVICLCEKGQGNMEAAFEAAVKRQSLMIGSPLAKTSTSAFLLVADMCLERGQYQKALKMCLDGQEKCRKIEDRYGQFKAMLITLNASALLLGSESGLPKSSKDFAITLEKALKTGKEAKELSEKLDQGRGAVSFWMGHLLMFAGRTKDALEEAELARIMFKESMDIKSKGNAGLLVADIYKAMDNKDDAMKALQDVLETAKSIKDEDMDKAAKKMLGDLGGGMGAGFDPAMLAMLQGMQMPAAAALPADAGSATPTADAVVPASAAPVKPAKPTKEIISKRVLSMAVDVSGEENLNMDTPLMEAGMDSLGAVSFRNDLAKEFDVTLGASVIFDYPSINALTGLILDSIA